MCECVGDRISVSQLVNLMDVCVCVSLCVCSPDLRQFVALFALLKGMFLCKVLTLYNGRNLKSCAKRLHH